MKKKLIIHGHFYQPPREDPFLDTVLKQESAGKYHDWNERIVSECYNPNAGSRVLDGYGRILKIVNNYEYLSFNFGATLLDYLYRKYPDTLERIIEADKRSVARLNGHGNAIAQVYNHTILPLASYEDMLVQIKWGIYNFKRYFGRVPEGIWLAETAINPLVVDALYECGIHFTVLSPFQASGVKNHRGEESLSDVSGGRIDTSRPYVLRGSSGNSIAAFFYDGSISQAIAFEHLLRHADKLSSKIEGAFSGGMPMLNIATDGESYGHHEPFGDMCLAKFFSDEAPSRGIEVTNYGAYLAENPPLQEVVLHAGEGGRGTSWSCAHGVERWRADCGCSSGPAHWNQKWRTPLREAFDALRIAEDKLAEEALNLSGKSLQEARENYVETIYDEKKAEELSVKIGCDSALYKRVFDSYRYSQYSYTSCGWFFSDVSGIEPVQNMRYAHIALSLMKDIAPKAPYVLNAEKEFLEKLSEAQSNIDKYKNGKFCYEKFVVENAYEHGKVLNHFLTCEISGKSKVSTGEYSLYNHKVNIKKAHSSLIKAQVKSPLLGAEDFIAEAYKAKNNVVVKIASSNASSAKEVKKVLEKAKVYSLEDILYEERESVVRNLNDSEYKSLYRYVSMAFKRSKKIILDYVSRSLEVSDEMKNLFKTFFSMHIESIMAQKPITVYKAGDYPEIENLIEFSNENSISVESTRFNNTVEKALEKHLSSLVNGFSLESFNEVMSLMYLVDKLKLNLYRYNLENTVYRVYEKYREENLTATEKSSLTMLGSWFNFNTDGWM